MRAAALVKTWLKHYEGEKAPKTAALRALNEHLGTRYQHGSDIAVGVLIVLTIVVMFVESIYLLLRR